MAADVRKFCFGKFTTTYLDEKMLCKQALKGIPKS